MGGLDLAVSGVRHPKAQAGAGADVGQHLAQIDVARAIGRVSSQRLSTTSKPVSSTGPGR